MNIKGINNYNNVYSSNSVAKNKNQKNKPSFTGHTLTQDVYGNNIYKFFLPNAPEGTKVVVTRLERDENDNFVPTQNADKSFRTAEYILSGKVPSYSLNADDMNLGKDVILGYKFILPNGKEHFDNTAKAIIKNKDGSNSVYTMASPVWIPNSKKARVLEHIMPDAFNVKDPQKLHAKRNHFNVLGGTINSIREKLPMLKETGYTECLGLPLFGNDNNSSHGYWTTNAYQVTKNLGNIKDFKYLMLDLYKNDMRWMADGAFVNEGIPGIHISDFVNWGADSPLVDMFETKDLENIPARFGVFSKNKAVNIHAHLKLVNAPRKIIFEKSNDGTYREKAVKRNHNFDPTKPTFVQLFDDRLATEEQMNSDEVFSVYGKKETDNNFEIANYRDSVQAYYRRVPVKEAEDNYEKYKEAKSANKNVQFKNILTKWKNFEFVESNKDGGISLWVGNSDISKKQFVIPESAINENWSVDKKLQKRAAQYQVQDDTVQIGKFWTSEVARLLTEYTAKEIIEKINKSKGSLNYKQAIQTLIEEGALPQTASKILEETDGVSALDNILETDLWGEGRNYKLKETKMPENITDGLMAFPMDAIEFSPDLISVFTYPFVKNLAVNEETVGKSRYEMYQMGDDYYSQMPERYREIYKKADNLFVNEMTNKANEIMHNLSAEMGKNLIDADNNLTSEGKDIYSLIASDIAKFLIVSSLAPDVKPDFTNKDLLFYNPEKLSEISLTSLSLQYETSPEAMSEALLNRMQNGLNNLSDVSQKQFVSYLATRLNNINSDSINVAKLIVDKTESGLDWRIDAAKDVGSYDAVDDGQFNFKENESQIMRFWKKFNSGVRQYDPNSFSIGELTDWGDFPKSVFTSKTDFSTTSEYEKFHSSLLAMYGCDSEAGHIPNNEFAKEVYSKLESFLNTGYASDVNFAHRFVDNHDKPRALHLLSLNMNHFKDDKSGAMKAAMKRAMESTSEFQSLEQKYKNSLYKALDTLSGGHVIVDGVKREFDAENFGIRPFDFNIESLIKEAIEEDYEFARFATNPDNAVKLKKLRTKTLNKMLEGGMEKYRAIWFAMNALPGMPTNYAGTELAMTGWETGSKNEKQENRNPLRWDRLEDSDYSFIKEFKDKLAAITKIRTKDGASALVNGTLIPIKSPGHNAAAFYRYNDKTDAICVLHANGFTEHELSKGSDVGVNKLDLEGLPNGLEVGTIYVDALNPSSKYKVTNPYEIKKVDDNDTDKILENINLGNAGLILLRETDFDGNKFTFKNPEKTVDPRVKLANTKINIPQ